MGVQISIQLSAELILQLSMPQHRLIMMGSLMWQWAAPRNVIIISSIDDFLAAKMFLQSLGLLYKLSNQINDKN